MDAQSEMDGGPESVGLLCLFCEYDLRGQSGDPLRCPECGQSNTLSDLEYAAGLTEKEVNSFETPIAVCMGSLLVLALTGGSWLVSRFICGLVLAVPAGIAWAWSIYIFGAVHGFRRPWLGVIAWFHLAVFAFTAPFGLLIAVFWGSTSEVFKMTAGPILMLASVLLTQVLKRPWSEPYNPYKIARKKLRRLSRATAVGAVP